MSDLRPEFRPLAFPQPGQAARPGQIERPVHTAGGPSATPMQQPAMHVPSENPPPSGFLVEANCEPEDAFCDESFAADESDSGAECEDGHSAIAGRIGTPHGESTPGDLVEMVLRLGQRLRGHLDGRFGTFGLSDARFAALSVIREAAPAGCTQAHLATKLGQCESSISTLVERMRASHLLYRLRAKSDRRKRVLMLTDEGRALLEQGLACRDREAQTLFSQMSTDEQRELAQVLGRLFATLDRAADAMPEREVERPAA